MTDALVLKFPEGGRQVTEEDRLIGLKLREARSFRRMSQADLAAGADLSYQQIQKYETGLNRISVGTLYRLAKALKLQPMWFFETLDPVAEAERPPPVGAEQRALLEQFDRIESSALRKAVLAFVKSLADTIRTRST